MQKLELGKSEARKDLALVVGFLGVVTLIASENPVWGSFVCGLAVGIYIYPGVYRTVRKWSGKDNDSSLNIL